MKAIVLVAAALVLAGCNEEKRANQLIVINDKLPRGCVAFDVGQYASIRHVLVVMCDEVRATSANYSWPVGKARGYGATVQIMGEQ